MTGNGNSNRTAQGASWVGGALRFALGNYGLLVFTGLLILMFGILTPGTFLTTFSWRSILSTSAIVLCLGLAETVVIAAQQFDLSVGYLAGFCAIIIVTLQAQHHVPWPLAVFAGLAAGLIGGALNGLVVTVLRIDSFIATLGTGTIVYGLAQFVTGGVQITGNFPQSFQVLGGAVAGIPVPALIGLAAAVVTWIVLEFSILGRRLYVVGANVRAAVLTGLKPPRIIRQAFLISGLLVGLGGVMLAAEFQVAQANIGPDYLLPAFAAAFLGSTSVRPGRVNVWGSVVAVLLLGIADVGLLQLGASFYVSSLFSGGLLIVAVGAAVLTGDRKRRSEDTTTALDPASSTGSGEGDDGPSPPTEELSPASSSALGAAVQRYRRSGSHRDG